MKIKKIASARQNYAKCMHLFTLIYIEKVGQSHSEEIEGL